jgi:restriction endonuclease S subunit
MTVEEYKKKIGEIFERGGGNYKNLTEYKLSNSDVFKVNIGKRIVETEFVENGKYPAYSANVFEPFGRVDKDLPIDDLDFTTASVLWGIDGDWMVNYIPANVPFYPTDHCGVLRVKTNEIHPRFLAGVLNVVGKEQRFSRTLRASIDRIKSITVKVPPLAEQKRIVAEIEKYEAAIAQAQAVMEGAAEKKKEILGRWLEV